MHTVSSVDAIRRAAVAAASAIAAAMANVIPAEPISARFTISALTAVYTAVAGVTGVFNALTTARADVTPTATPMP